MTQKNPTQNPAAEAIAPGFSPWTKESAEACLITTDGNGKENKRRALRFLIKQASEAAAIQRGDGQTTETSGATPRTDREEYDVSPLGTEGPCDYVVSADFARQLERELAAVRKSAGAEDVLRHEWEPVGFTSDKCKHCGKQAFVGDMNIDSEACPKRTPAAAKPTPDSGLSALDFTRLRDWFADPQRKPAMLAFTAGPARDAATAFESAASGKDGAK